MKISSNNHMADAFSSFVVSSDADTNQDIGDIVEGDFSTAYTSLGSSGTFTFKKTFSTGFSCEYVAFAGHNFSDINGGTLVIKVNNVTKGTVSYFIGEPNWVTMVHFDAVTCTSVEFIFTKNVATDRATISYVSLGALLDTAFVYTQNNEEGGWPINWRTFSKNIRATVNDSASPVAYVRQSISRKATLTLNNIARSTIQSVQWLDFLGSVFNGGDFFIKDEDGDTTGITDEPKATIMGFAADAMPPKTHSATRQLVNLSIKMQVKTGE